MVKKKKEKEAAPEDDANLSPDGDKPEPEEVEELEDKCASEASS